MRFNRVSAFAALAGTAAAAKDSRTFVVAHFNDQPLTIDRLDPIVSPGGLASHVHTVLGASAFGANVTYEDLVNTECTDNTIKGDNSIYWVPQLYYMDTENGTFESVPLFYGQIYYFFEPTNDDIVAFPEGLQIFTGNVSERNPPKGGCTGNQDPSKGPVQNVRWTCPRSGDEENPPSWPAGSDGTMAGMGDPNNKGEGCGFPDVSCDGSASPLRMDIHLPSCWNPAAGLTNYLENMAFPTDAGNGKQDCPPGWWHVPHLFFEFYWNTLIFRGRWQEGVGRQPFVLANGDITGMSGHADFISGWNRTLLQHLIDTCDAGTSAMDKCEGVEINNLKCQRSPTVNEQTLGTLTALPGNNPVTGWWMGTGDNSGNETPPPPSSSGNGVSEPDAPTSTPTPHPTASQSSSSSSSSSQTSTAASSSTKSKPCKASTMSETTTMTSTISMTSTVTVSQCTTTTSTTSTPQPASPSGTAVPSGSILGFTYVGCFQDTDARVLRGETLPALGPMTTEKCLGRCQEHGFSLGGTEFGGQCFCGDELIGSSKIDESNCSMPCEGDSSEICGGGLALSVYSSTGQAGVAGVPGVSSVEKRHRRRGHH